MADLGAIGRRIGGTVVRRITSRAVQESNQPGANLLDVPVDGSLYGTVKIATVLTGDVLARLYYRPNGLLIEQAKTIANGTYRFDALNKADLKNYYVTFLDPNENAPYNFTVTKDHLTPG